MTTQAQRDYSRTGDIDRLLEEILLPPSNHRRPPDREEEPVVYARVYKRTRPDAADVKTPVEAGEPRQLQQQQQQQQPATILTKQQRCQSYEVLEKVSVFRVHPAPLGVDTSCPSAVRYGDHQMFFKSGGDRIVSTRATQGSHGHRQLELNCGEAATAAVFSGGEQQPADENCATEYTTEIAALRPIGKGIHTLKTHQVFLARPVDRVGRRPLHQSAPALQQLLLQQAGDENRTGVTGQRSYRVGQLRAATLQASSVTQFTWHDASKQQQQKEQTVETSESTLLEVAKATSCQWYRPTLSRDEVSSILKSQAAGNFLVRRSASHPGCCDLAVRVSLEPSPAVRHFLIERCATGVRIRGGGSQATEFASLAALVATAASATGHPAIPCRLRLPAPLSTSQQPPMTASARTIVRKPECAALYLAAVDVETATGAAAVARATDALMRSRHRTRPRPCRLVATPDGGLRICGLDGDGQSVGEKCIPAACILHCGYDPSMRSFDSLDESLATGLVRPKIFGFVLRKRADIAENTVILACDSGDPQGADTLVNFVRRSLGLS